MRTSWVRDTAGLVFAGTLAAACSDSRSPLSAPSTAALAASAAARAGTPHGQIKHVMLISIDGMHSQDLARYVGAAGDECKTGQRDHGVASPISKPVIAGDYAVAVWFSGETPFDDELIGG